jgi:hypothetical protein
MKTLLLFATAAGLAAPAADELRTDYTAERTLRVSSEMEVTVETTDFALERDGEPVDTGGFGGRGPSTTVTKVVHLDKVTDHADGVPTGLERSYETATRSDGEETVDSPLDGETIELTLGDDGVVEAAMASGAAPDQDSVLEGHRLTLALDALLPEGEVSAEDSWELDGEAVVAALGIDHAATLFPRREWQPGGGPGGGDGERRRGPRMMGGQTAQRLFQEAEWEATARLAAETASVEGIDCLVIELDLEAEGELEDQEPQWGGGRGRSAGLETSAAVPLETEFEIDLEGRLFFSVEEGRPLALEVEGEFSLDTERTRERGESTMTIFMAQEGSFSLNVLVTEEETE